MFNDSQDILQVFISREQLQFVIHGLQDTIDTLRASNNEDKEELIHDNQFVIQLLKTFL